MKYNIYLDPGAVRALVFANLAGPNCQKNPRAACLINSQSPLELKELVPYFDLNFGPLSSLINYCVTSRNGRTGDIYLTAQDIVRIYCLFHFDLVRIAEVRFLQSGQQDEYFKELKENGFRLNRKSLSRYLFSCLGKIGVVEKVKNGFCLVRTYLPGGISVVIHDIYCPFKIRRADKVAVHFAAIIAVVDDELFEQIKNLPVGGNGWLKIFRTKKRVCCRQWLGGNLAEYTKDIFSHCG